MCGFVSVCPTVCLSCGCCLLCVSTHCRFGQATSSDDDVDDDVDDDDVNDDDDDDEDVKDDDDDDDDDDVNDDDDDDDDDDDVSDDDDVNDDDDDDDDDGGGGGLWVVCGWSVGGLWVVCGWVSGCEPPMFRTGLCPFTQLSVLDQQGVQKPQNLENSTKPNIPNNNPPHDCNLIGGTTVFQHCRMQKSRKAKN